MKLALRILLSPLWGPFWLIGAAGRYTIVTIVWLLTNLTWQDAWDEILGSTER